MQMVEAGGHSADSKRGDEYDMVEVIVLLPLLGTSVVYYLLQQRTQPHARRSEIERNFRRQSEIQRGFLRVFPMTSAQGKEGLMKRWMNRSGCDRTEAMRLATEERGGITAEANFLFELRRADRNSKFLMTANGPAQSGHSAERQGRLSTMVAPATARSPDFS